MDSFLQFFRTGAGGRGNDGELSIVHGSELPCYVDDNRVAMHANQHGLNDPSTMSELPTNNCTNENTQGVFAGHKLTVSSEDDEGSSLESYMKKRGRRRPSQDFLDSRHLLPWQRYQENRKYAPVKYVIPEKSKQINSNNTNKVINYPFEFNTGYEPPVSSSISESSIPSTMPSLTLNLRKSPTPALSSASESEGSDRNINTETSPRIRCYQSSTVEVDEVNSNPKDFSGSAHGKITHDQATTSIAHHIPKHATANIREDNIITATNISTQEPADVRQSSSYNYYQRRRSHQALTSYGRDEKVERRGCCSKLF